MIRISPSSFRVLRRTGAIHPSIVAPSFEDHRRQQDTSSIIDPRFVPTNVALIFPISTASAGRRNFSSSSSSSGASDDANQQVNVDETLNKLFDDSQHQQQINEAAASPPDDAWYATAEAAAGVDWTPTWWPSDQAIEAVLKMHELSGLEYGWSIVATTVVLRSLMFPLMVQAQRTTSRMAHVSPELNVMKERYERLGTPSRQEQLQFANQSKALLKKYNVNPLGAIVAPLVQLPVFVGMFLGLKKMPSIFPEEMATGGMYWFTDLTVPDPTYILPLCSAATFLAMIEIGKDQMKAQSPGPKGEFMLNFFRFCAVMSLPVMMNFEASMLCYWTANNTLSLIQTSILKMPAVRKYLGIWEPPKPIPGQETPDLAKSVTNLVKRIQGEPVTEEQKIKRHNDEVEAKKTSFRMAKASRERRKARGITGTKNR